MTDINQKPKKLSPLHGFLSLILPGLGQAVAGSIGRALVILATMGVGYFLTAWTIAQKARYPDTMLGGRIFGLLVLQFLVLGLMFTAVGYLLKRVIKKEVSSSLINGILSVLFIAAGILLSSLFLNTAGTADEVHDVHAFVAVLSGIVYAFIWRWQVLDAMELGGEKGKSPSFRNGILIFCALILILGFNLTEVDIYKAVQEIADTQSLLVRILWPWEAAFHYDVERIEATAKVQAPCPEGAAGPEMNVPLDDQPWVVVSPNCGDLSYRSMSGSIDYGSEMTIVGGGFKPGEEVELMWKNPIGNPFKPRGFGDTEIDIDENGEFASILIIPDALVVEHAQGDQVHTMSIIQESIPVFTTKLSPEMQLALKGMLETIMMGLMATFTGVIIAAPVAFLAARNIMSPIVVRVSAFSGGALGTILGILAGNKISSLITDSMGGLAEAPIQTAIIFFIFFFTFAFGGWKIGSTLLEKASLKTSPMIGKLLTALSFGIIGAGIGYLLGLGFNSGVLAIVMGDSAAQYETISALVGAVLIGLVSLGFSLRADANSEFPMGSLIYTVARVLMNVVRSIEPLIWAIIGIIWIGPGPFAGFIALTLHTIAALGKLYSEAIESIDPGPIEALQATGATRLQTIIFAIVPQILPPWISFTIYRWDINVRMSTIIGLVGGGGIGFILIQWIRLFQYDAVGLAVWLITITVAVLDFVSSDIRERYI